MDMGLGLQTIMFRMDKQQGPNVYHRELYSISYDKPEWKKIYIFLAESLCCMAEINTMF